MPNNRQCIAKRLKQLLIEFSFLMEEFTAVVCPVCTEVCCKQKHGLYQQKDVLFLDALDVETPARDATRPLDGPCEAMGPKGCVLPRWLRPFKCTWYFCDPLLAVLNENPPKNARMLTALMEEMIGLYGMLR